MIYISDLIEARQARYMCARKESRKSGKFILHWPWFVHFFVWMSSFDVSSPSGTMVWSRMQWFIESTMVVDNHFLCTCFSIISACAWHTWCCMCGHGRGRQEGVWSCPGTMGGAWSWLGTEKNNRNCRKMFVRFSPESHRNLARLPRGCMGVVLEFTTKVECVTVDRRSCVLPGIGGGAKVLGRIGVGYSNLNEKGSFLAYLLNFLRGYIGLRVRLVEV